MFLEEDVDNPPGDREDRWWWAYHGTSAGLPLTMVDSGHQISNGYVDFYNTYKAMVDSELSRPAEADIEAYYRRIGDHFRIYGRLTNLSGVTLGYNNSAQVEAIVYEETHVHLTDRYVRDAVSSALESQLAPGAAMTFTLDSSDLSGVNWNNMRLLVAADYLPAGYVGSFDMLQAAHAMPAAFTVQPDSLVFLVDPTHAVSQTLSIQLRGPHALNWTAVENIPWLSLSASSNSIATSPTAAVDPGSLSQGWQEGQVTFSAVSSDGMAFTQTVPAKAYYGPVNWVYIPIIMR